MKILIQAKKIKVNAKLKRKANNQKLTYLNKKNMQKN